jgi:hypothetical protein
MPEMPQSQAFMPQQPQSAPFSPPPFQQQQYAQPPSPAAPTQEQPQFEQQYGYAQQPAAQQQGFYQPNQQQAPFMPPPPPPQMQPAKTALDMEIERYQNQMAFNQQQQQTQQQYYGAQGSQFEQTQQQPYGGQQPVQPQQIDSAGQMDINRATPSFRAPFGQDNSSQSGNGEYFVSSPRSQSRPRPEANLDDDDFPKKKGFFAKLFGRG